jgi:hypothetical protein
MSLRECMWFSSPSLRCRLWHGRLFHSATPNYSSNPPSIRQLALYDVVKTSTFESFYEGYERGPIPSKPSGMQKGPLAPPTSSLTRLPAHERAQPDFWWDWSDEVRYAGVAAAGVADAGVGAKM